ncbi:HEAT repeat domain-containing protein [uncultured Tateyamaria sp.]|uniref:HEAT repeat domain-containing protein n=1 Tax=uncultured Tateyamaria sp. TaxID=455651 RepID=UPI00342E014C
MDENTDVRAAVAHVLGCLGEQSADYANVLAELIFDEHDDVAKNALWAAGEVKSHDADIVHAIIGRHRDKNRDIRVRVAWTLAQLAVHNTDVHSAINNLVRDQDSTVRMYAVDACSNCGHPRLQKLIKRALSDRTVEVRGAACRVMRSTDLPSGRYQRRLLSLAKHDLHGVRLDAVHALITRWPDLINNPEIRSWMLANTGYWWVADALKR